jgi:hypothetical protein
MKKKPYMYIVKYTFNNIAIPTVGKPLQLKIMSIFFYFRISCSDMFVTWKPRQLTNTSMSDMELRVRRGCYVRIARLIPTEFVIVQGP